MTAGVSKQFIGKQRSAHRVLRKRSCAHAIIIQGRGNGAPRQSDLELILAELQDWEEQLRDADIDWDALEAEHLDHRDGP